ncbi:uncharacterized protein TrAFT101_011607 [Trichoderma asperellum]|uniref:uncharacterized protein n=1 Tax=Trichoderma asperellum TaxID=101201 RepID=UPI003320D721|nr:hypothetical protein TrAFT101_011607 [Trichoderma asperellum]
MRFQPHLTALFMVTAVTSNPVTANIGCNISQFINVPTTSGLITGHEPPNSDCVVEFLVDAGTYLNIWTKATNVAGANKPVLVFFFGGGFNYGGTDTAFYNGKYFASAQDVVVVTVNYRIDVFGFPGAPGQPANLGLRDQRVAVEWVHDDIAAFGGNPEKITIFGQSVGGEEVDFWAYAYEQGPIVSGIIAHSGNAFSFPLNTAAAVENNWNAIVAGVNCTNSEDQLACVR